MLVRHQPVLNGDLAALYDHYLLTEPAHGRYRMHDVIREHARALAAADPAPRVEELVRDHDL